MMMLFPEEGFSQWFTDVTTEADSLWRTEVKKRFCVLGYKKHCVFLLPILRKKRFIVAQGILPEKNMINPLHEHYREAAALVQPYAQELEELELADAIATMYFNMEGPSTYLLTFKESVVTSLERVWEDSYRSKNSTLCPRARDTPPGINILKNLETHLNTENNLLNKRSSHH